MLRKLILACGISALSLATSLPAMAQELAAEQVIRFGVGVDDFKTLDPHISIGTGEWPIYGPVYEAMVHFPKGTMDSGHLEPGLATDWSLDDSGLVWTFNLRKGVKWHGDHGEFTADDVVFSISRVLDPEFNSPFRKLLAEIDSVTALDDHTVEIRTSVVQPNLPSLLVNHNAGYIVSRHAVENGVDLRSHPVGTGPFVFAEYRPRESFALVANPDYWGGAPIAERLVVQFMPDGATRELALISGEIHGIEIPAQQDHVNRYRANGMEVDLTAPANMFTLMFNMTIDPISDIRVREALAAGIDRDGLVAFFGPDVAYAEFSPLPQGYVGHTDDVNWIRHDPEHARKLLAEAGFGDGLKLSMAVSNSNIYLPPMQVIQEMWSKIGVELELNVVDHPTYHSMIRENSNPVVLYGAFRYPFDGTEYLTQFYHSKSAIGQPEAITNFSHVGQVGDSIDEFIEKARVETDAAEQVRLWEEAQRVIMNEVAVVPLYTRNYALARSPHLDLGFETRSRSMYQMSEDARLLK